MRIKFDPGHGGSDPGAGANGLVEKTLNLQTAKLAAAALLTKCAGLVDKQGQLVDVRLTREDDSSLTPAERLRRIATFNPDICVSIHYNSVDNATATGSEVFHAIRDSRDDALAQHIVDLLKATGMPSRGIKTKSTSAGEDYYYIIGEVMDADTVAVLVEGAFLTNAEDAKKIKAGWVNQAAEAIAQAVFDYVAPQLVKKPASAPALKGPGVLISTTGQFFAGIMLEGRMYVPARAPFEAAGLKVDYDGATQIATIRR